MALRKLYTLEKTPNPIGYFRRYGLAYESSFRMLGMENEFRLLENSANAGDRSGFKDTLEMIKKELQ